MRTLPAIPSLPANVNSGMSNGVEAGGHIAPILVSSRVHQEAGLWYTRQEGIVKAGEGRHGSPYIVGQSQIMQVRDIYKLVFINLNVMRRTSIIDPEVEAALAAAQKKEEEAKALEERRKKEQEEGGDEEGGKVAALKISAAERAKWEALTDEEKAQREEEKTREVEEEVRKAKEEAERIEQLKKAQIQKFATRVKITAYLVRKPPKSRMMDIEEVGVQVLFDKGGDAFDGCLYTTETGEGQWAYLEQGLLKIPHPDQFKGVCIVKRAKDKPVTAEPIMYGFARLDMLPERLRSTDAVLGMREMKDLHERAKTTASFPSPSLTMMAIKSTTSPSTTTTRTGAPPPQKGSALVMAKALKAFGVNKEKGKVVDISKLKSIDLYNRLVDRVWTFLQKSHEDLIDFEAFQQGLDHLEFYLLEPRALRLFEACDLKKVGKISSSDFQVGLMINDIIPAPTGLMPLDAFKLFDFEKKGNIGLRQFIEIAKALGVQETETRLEEVFVQADQDKSGSMDFKEFKDFYVKLVKVNDELKRRGIDPGVLAIQNQQSLRQTIDQEEEAMLESFKVARPEVEERLRLRRIERDEIKRKKQEEEKQLKRLQKLTTAYKKQQKAEAQKREARDRAKNKIEEQAMKAQLKAEEASLKQKKEEDIREIRRQKEEDRAREIRMKGLDRWDLRNKNFTEVPESMYVGLEAQNRLDILVLLDLSENKLDSLPAEDFLYWMNSLRELNLSHNRLCHLPADIRSCAKLELLNLSNNKLLDLPPDIGLLKQLKHLNLFKNSLKRLPPEIGELQKLRVLDLQCNDINDFPLELAHCSDLIKLDIGQNQISFLPDDLSRLISLKDLSMASNTINYLPVDFGEHLFNLKFVDLNFNQLCDLPDSFRRLNKLVTLRMRGNQLRELGEYLEGMEALIEIDASKNIITTISPCLESCIELQSLRLAANRIKALPPEIGALVNLEQLDLRENGLEALLPEMRTLTSLHSLDVSNNALRGPLLREIGMLTGMRTMNLAFNGLTNLPETIGNVTRLEVLNAGHNQINELPLTIQACSALHTINVGGNALTRFPEILVHLESLKDVNLSANAIPYLPRSISVMEDRMMMMDLSKNLLRALPPEFDQFYRKVKQVYIDNNPWSDLPCKWNSRWTVKEQGSSRSGYSVGEVLEWAKGISLYYDTCCKEWQATGALHYTGRATLADFVLGVNLRLGNRWRQRFEQGVTRLYFSAKEQGYIPRFYQVSVEQEVALEAKSKNTQEKKEVKVALTRQQHLERIARFREYYLMEDQDFQEYPPIKKKDRLPSSLLQTAEDKRRMQARFRRAVSRSEVRTDILARQKAYELDELKKEVERRMVKQEERKVENEAKDRRICEEEMVRLRKVAQDNPFW